MSIVLNTNFPTNSGEPMPTPEQSAAAIPSEILDALIEHVARYRLTLFPALQRLPAFADLPPSRIKAMLKTARKEQWLASATLHGGASYWYLTTTGAEKAGIPPQRCGPLSEPAKFRAYALLRFCCLSDRPRHRLMPNELKRHFPELDRPGLPSGYYLDPSGPKRLGFLRIDTGHHGRWDRVLQTLREDVRDHAIQPAFARLMRADRFEITLVTVFRPKAERLRASLATCPEARQVPVQVLAVPELLPLIIGSRRSKGGARR